MLLNSLSLYLAIYTWAAYSFHCPLNCKCPSVDIAFCFGEDLTSLPVDLNPRLIELRLIRTSVTQLHFKEFSRLSALNILELSGNGIITIDRQSFVGLSSLWRLKLKENNLQLLQPGFLQGLVSLKVIYVYRSY